jgi:glucose 1-dehydrogenase
MPQGSPRSAWYAGRMRLQGKVALVTGSSRGIGREIARRLAREGADVAIHYNRSPEGAAEAMEDVRGESRRTHVVQGNLASAREAARIVEEAIAHLGRLDVLVNNAGVEKECPFWDVSEEDYDLVVDVNLKGVFFATQAFVRHLRSAGRPGKVVNVTSVHEDMAFPGYAAYCASKGGVRMLTRNLAVELGPLGITVNGVAPGAIATDINAKVLGDERKREALVANIPLGRIGQTADVASVVAFLASRDADYVTGATYVVDGGLMVHYEE